MGAVRYGDAVNGRTLDSLEKALAAMRGHLGQLGT
jgi:hypothetical protein